MAKKTNKEKKIKKKRPFLGLIIITIFTCLAVAGAFVWRHFQDKSSEEETVVVVHKNVVITSSFGGSVNLQSVHYDKGEKLDLKATAEDGFSFVEWVVEGDGSVEDKKSASTTFKVPEKDVVISAVFKMNDMKELSEEQSAVYKASSGLTVGYAAGDYADSVVNKLVLPNTYGYEANEVSIKWSSSDTSVVSDSGEISRAAEDKQVVLTATMSKGSVTAEKTFNITVIAKNDIVVDDIANLTVQEIEKLNKDNEIDYRLQYNDEASQLTRVRGMYSDISVKSVDAALYSLYSVRSLIGIENPKEELSWIATNHDGVSRSYTFAQLYDGIPVYGTTVTVVADMSGKTQALRSSLVARSNMSGIYDTGNLSEDAVSGDYNNVISCQKTLYAIGDYEKKPVLAYKITTKDKVIIASAENGNELTSYSNNAGYGEYTAMGKGEDEHGAFVNFPVSYNTDDGVTYYLEDIERGIYVYGDESGDTAKNSNANWADSTAISAYTNVITVYDWLQEKLGRNSIDDNGNNIIVNVHDYKKEGLYGTAHYENATNEICFFDNKSGNAPTVASDIEVVAHEMLHGMFNSILSQNGAAELPYAGDVGAIYEGYSRVLSEYISGKQLTYNSGVSDASATDAQHIPNFQNHGSYATPVTISDGSFYNGDDADIYVHTNSNLVTNLNYLLVASGLSEEDALKLWYSSIMLGYDAHSDFDDFRDNMEQAAVQNGFSDEQFEIIMQAFDDEEIYSQRGSLAINFTNYDGSEATEEQLKKVKQITLHRLSGGVPNSDYTGTDTRFDSIYYGDYELEITFDGYVTFKGIVNIEENRLTEVTAYFLNEGTGKVQGVITSATTGEVMKDVKLTVYSGYNTRTGEEVTTYKTKENGEYSLELPAGYYTVKLSKSKFVDSYFNIVSDGGKTIKDVNASISMHMEMGSSYRVVLSWGLNPEDLDAHLRYNSENDSYHIHYNEQVHEVDGKQIANLDVDDRHSYGPETTTFTVDANGSYDFYIVWYEGSGTWAESNAKVEVYNGSMLAYVYNVPMQNDRDGDWNIFSINNGIYKSINEIYENEYYDPTE